MSTDLVEIVFSFDTTGSMYPCLEQVRKNVNSALSKLFAQMPNLRIGLAAHGDYGDLRGSAGYTTRWHSLTTDINSLSTFVRTVGRTAGFGNGGEAYEVVLNEAKSLNWSAEAVKKIIVMIGDEPPHTPDWYENVHRLDWRQEAKELAQSGVVIYPVQCLSRRESNTFYRGLADITGGHYLRLDQFSEIVDLIYAICYGQEADSGYLDQLEQDLVARGRMSRTMDETFRKLTGRAADPSRYANVNPDLIPVDPGRFQILDVDFNTDIKGFVLNNGLPFKIGRGFYQFTKTETIQARKEIVLRHKQTGDMFSGDQARIAIGAPLGDEIRLRPTHLNEYDVYVQSTSVNRKLIGGTKFLYEVDLTQ
jgi:hypothetical protein